MTNKECGNAQWQDEECLGKLAMTFRSTRDGSIRTMIAKDYSAVVLRLIQRGRWEEIPGFEDQLPDEWMPKEFFAYWFGEHHELAS